jgi:hypothetical protein
LACVSTVLPEGTDVPPAKHSSCSVTVATSCILVALRPIITKEFRIQALWLNNANKRKKEKRKKEEIYITENPTI